MIQDSAYPVASRTVLDVQQDLITTLHPTNKHLYRHHPDVLNQTIHPAAADNDRTQDDDPELHPNDPCDDISDPPELDANSLQECEQLKRSAALFILKTAVVRKLTLTAVN